MSVPYEALTDVIQWDVYAERSQRRRKFDVGDDVRKWNRVSLTDLCLRSETNGHLPRVRQNLGAQIEAQVMRPMQ